MVPLLRVPSIAIPLEPMKVTITFANGTVRSYPNSVLDALGIDSSISTLKTHPNLFELLLNLKKKCLHEVAGEWIFENPRFFEELQDLINQLYGDKNDHPFTFIKEELSTLTLAQADTLLRAYDQNSKMEERREKDTVVRFCAEPAPFLVKVARQIVSRRLRPDFFLLQTSLKHDQIRTKRRIDRKKAKLLNNLPILQKTRLEETVAKLSRHVEYLQKQLDDINITGYPDLSRLDKDSREVSITVKFIDGTSFIYPPRLRKYLYSCQFYRNDKPIECVSTFIKREDFEIIVKLIEGTPLRKQLGNRLSSNIWLFENLSNASRLFTQKFHVQVQEELRYITLEEAIEIKNQTLKSYLYKIAEEILDLANYFSSIKEASEFFKERSELFDEVQRLKRKLEKNKSELNQTLFDKEKEKLDLMDSRMKCLPISIQGLRHLAENVPEKSKEASEKINAYRNEIFSLLNIPEHLKDYVDLFDYYGFAVRNIDGKTVVSFCGYKDFEFDFEYVSGYEFETVLRRQIEFVFPAAGDPTYESKYDPQTNEEKIKANPQLYMNLPRQVAENCLSVSIPENVKISREAFLSGKPSIKDIHVLIATNKWERYGFKPEDIAFEKEVNIDFNECILFCIIKNYKFIINPITLRAPIKGCNMIRTTRILEEKFKKDS